MADLRTREYGVATTITFELYEPDGASLQASAVHAVGDSKVMKDEGGEANTTNAFVDEGQTYSIALTAAEMTAARIVLIIVDQTNPPIWGDRVVHIETYGNASAQHDLVPWADAVLARNLASVSGASSRSLLNAIRALRNRVAIAAGTITVYEEDDATPAWTGAVTTAAGNPIVQIDPA